MAVLELDSNELNKPVAIPPATSPKSENYEAVAFADMQKEVKERYSELEKLNIS